jgi:hypothetical protein
MKLHYCVHKNPQFVPILRQAILVKTHPHSLFKLHFNLILPTTPFLQPLPPAPYAFLCTSPYMLHVLPPYNCTPNNIMKLVIILFFITLSPKCCHQHPILPSMWHTKFHTPINKKKLVVYIFNLHML